MLQFMNAWLDGARLAADAQRVMALRAMRFAGGHPASVAESQRMVFEKFAALGEAQMAAMLTLMKGGSLQAAAARAVRPYRKRVRANRRRLGR